MHIVHHVILFLSPSIPKRYLPNPRVAKIKSLENAFPELRSFRHQIPEYNV